MNPPPFKTSRLQYLIAQNPAALTAGELCELADALAWCQKNHVSYLEITE